jgi:gamma-glutamylcyclotransferase (GGCT)/AIG2-like uncharacterized protein YtfP
VCTTLRGARPTPSAGFHVWLSVPDVSLAAINALIALYMKYERPIWRLVSSPELAGTPRPMDSRMPNRIPAGGYSSFAQLPYKDGDRNHAINLTKVREHKIEFRIADARFRPGEIQAIIKIFRAMKDTAARADPDRHAVFVPEPLGRSRCRSATTPTSDADLLAESRSVREFLDEIFDLEADRVQAIQLWASSLWYPGAEPVPHSSTPPAVFAYGTLMPGAANWRHLEPFAVSTVPASADGQLFDTGSGFAAAQFGGAEPIPGALIQIAPERIDEALAVLDRLEDLGNQFRRIVVPTSSGSAYAYETLVATDGLPHLPAGWVTPGSAPVRRRRGADRA